MAVLSLALASMMNIMNSAQQDTASQMGRDNFRGALLQAFDHPALCAATIANQANPTGLFDVSQAAPAPTPNPLGLGLGLPLNISLGGASIRSLRPADYFGKAAPTPIPLPQYNIAYQYIVFQNAVLLGADPNTPGNDLWQGVVTMTAFKMGGVSNLSAPISGGNSLAPITIGTLIVSVNSQNNNITGCESITAVNNACANFGGPNPAPVPGGPLCAFSSPCTNGIFQGNDSNGSPICSPLPQQPCAKGSGLTVNAQGQLTCTAL
jgi:hypothetical protein